MPKKSAPKSITLNEEQRTVVSARAGYFQLYTPGPEAARV